MTDESQPPEEEAEARLPPFLQGILRFLGAAVAAAVGAAIGVALDLPIGVTIVLAAGFGVWFLWAGGSIGHWLDHLLP